MKIQLKKVQHRKKQKKTNNKAEPCNKCGITPGNHIALKTELNKQSARITRLEKMIQKLSGIKVSENKTLEAKSNENKETMIEDNKIYKDLSWATVAKGKKFISGITNEADTSFKITTIQNAPVALAFKPQKPREQIPEKIQEQIKLNKKEMIEHKVTINDEYINEETYYTRSQSIMELTKRTIGYKANTKMIASLTDITKKKYPTLRQEELRIKTLKIHVQNYIKKDLKMEHEDYEKIKIDTIEEIIVKTKTNDYESHIKIVMQDKESAELATRHYKNLSTNNDKVIRITYPQAKNRLLAYDSETYCFRKSGYNTKIRDGKNDYLILAKKKDDTTAWNNLSPMIEPEDLPLFEVGKLKPETKQNLINEQNKRRNDRIEKQKIKEQEEKISEAQETQNEIDQFNAMMEEESISNAW